MLAHRWKKKQQLKKAKCARDHHLAARLALSDVRSRFYRLRRLIFKKKKKKACWSVSTRSPCLPPFRVQKKLSASEILRYMLQLRHKYCMHVHQSYCIALHGIARASFLDLMKYLIYATCSNLTQISACLFFLSQNIMHAN